MNNFLSWSVCGRFQNEMTVYKEDGLYLVSKRTNFMSMAAYLIRNVVKGLLVKSH